jgi:F-type H+-transporting ATPase subunit gamma
MPESLVETKRRIRSIQSTEKITKAMKMVAAVRFQKWKKTYDNNQFYRHAMHDTMVRTLASFDFSKAKKMPECLESYPSPKNLYIIISSSLGLCGAYNYNIFKMTDELIRPEDDLLLIGQKSYLHYKDRPNKEIVEYVNLLDNLTYDNVRMLRHFIFRLYRTGEYHSVILIYTRYQNSLTFVPVQRQLLPIDLSSLELEKNSSAIKPTFDPNPKEVLDLILPHYIDASLYNKVLECQVSEFASRRNAMETATDSADKITNQLKIIYNKSRQNAITQEITEVVAGANADKDED